MVELDRKWGEKFLYCLMLLSDELLMMNWFKNEYAWYDVIYVELVFYKCWVCIWVMHESLNTCVWLCLIVNCGLTSSGCLVDRLPYPYGWVNGVHD